jgi:hypothetical protein
MTHHKKIRNKEFLIIVNKTVGADKSLLQRKEVSKVVEFL